MDEEELLSQHQIQWLKAASPDDWHRAADNHNWDDRLDILYWIVRQPECDKATALLIFWRGEPTGHDFETDEEEMGSDPYAVEPLLKYIVQRFNTTGYPRSEIAFNYIAAKGGSLNSEYDTMMENGRLSDLEELAERQKELANPLLKIHPDLKLSKIPGRIVGGYSDTNPFYDNFPTGLEDYQDEEDAQLNRDLIETDRPTTAFPSASNAQIAGDLDSDASARIRAMRRGADPESQTSSDSDSSQSSGQRERFSTRQADTTTPDLSELRVDAAALIANLMIMGFAAVYLKVHAQANFFDGTGVLVAIALTGYLIYSSVSSFRDLQKSAAANNMHFLDRRSTIVVNASFVLGGLIAYFSGAFFSGLGQKLIASLGMIPALIAGFVVVLPLVALIGWFLAPLLINRPATNGAGA